MAWSELALRGACPTLILYYVHDYLPRGGTTVWYDGGQIEQVAAALPMRLKITHHLSLIPPAAPDRSGVVSMRARLPSIFTEHILKAGTTFCCHSRSVMRAGLPCHSAMIRIEGGSLEPFLVCLSTERPVSVCRAGAGRGGHPNCPGQAVGPPLAINARALVGEASHAVRGGPTRRGRASTSCP